MTTENKAPAGYTERSSDVTGIWDPDMGPIHFIPRGARLSDSRLDKTKTSTLIVGELVDPCKVTDAQDNVVEAKKGAQIGLWYKPGMSELKSLSGVPVFMYKSGTKDVGKASPMITFACHAPKDAVGGKLPILSDNRVTSKPKPTQPNGGAGQGFTQDADEMPF